LTFNQKELVSPYHPQIDFITKKWKKKAENIGNIRRLTHTKNGDMIGFSEMMLEKNGDRIIRNGDVTCKNSNLKFESKPQTIGVK
jgi:hypothetical protein